jgi:hypothetical protein
MMGVRYLQDIISEKTWTLLADDRLVNPFLVTLLKMANLHSQNQEHNKNKVTLAVKRLNL